MGGVRTWGLPAHPLKAFFKAVFVGTVAGAVLPMAFTVPIAIADVFEPTWEWRYFLLDIYAAVMPACVAFVIVLPSSLLVGLPVHFVFRALGIVSRADYVSAGFVAGLLVTFGILFAIGAVSIGWLSVLGGFSGAMTALSWSNSLEATASEQDEELRGA